MVRSAFLLFIVLGLGIISVTAQNESFQTQRNVENISTQILQISKSLEELNKKLGSFSETFSSNQGIRLTEKQRILLFAFEMLNRAESRLATLQVTKVQLAEREASTKRRIAQIEDNMRTESIDRTINGTTNAEQVRESRRRALQTEKNDLTKLLFEIQDSLRDSNFEIVQTERFLKTIRNRIFPEVEKELLDL